MKRQRMTEEKFEVTKLLLRHGLNKTRVAEIVGISRNSVIRMDQSADFTDYKRRINELNRSRQGAKKVEAAPLSTGWEEEVLQVLKNLAERLDMFEAKLDDVIERKRVWWK